MSLGHRKGAHFLQLLATRFTKLLVLLAPQVGLEPTTLRLTAECSAIELLRSVGARFSPAIISKPLPSSATPACVTLVTSGGSHAENRSAPFARPPYRGASRSR